MVTSYTLITGDVQYLSFYLKENDITTSSISYTNLTGANSIVFRMRLAGETINAIQTTCEVIENTLGYVRALVTIPTTIGKYSSEVEMFTSIENITWKGNTYYIQEELG